MPPPGAPTSKTLPPPRTELLQQAARDLALCDWQVIRSDDDASQLDVKGDHEFSAELFVPLPPSSGTPKGFAWTLIVQVAARLSRNVSSDHLGAWEAAAPPSLTAGEKEAFTLRAARGSVCNQVENLAMHGDRDGNGRHLEPYDALMRRIVDAGSAPPLTDEVEDTDPAADTQPSLPSPVVSRKARKPAPPSEPRRPPSPVKMRPEVGELRKAVKYVFSSAMGIEVAVNSISPLRFSLTPGPGFARRFNDLLAGGPRMTGKAAAQTLILRAMKDIVERGLDDGKVRAWLPTIAWDHIEDEAVQRHASVALVDEIKRRVAALIDDKGSIAFERYAHVGDGP